MKKAFTLIELLVVVAIMGLLGTVSVGGYRQLQRGMEERGVMQNVNQFIRNAYQRAQIDRVPTEVYFWNETIREATENENEIVVGRAVAVRRHGRLSQVTTGSGGGDLLIDEFGDLEQYDEDGAYADAPNSDSGMRLYQMEGGDSMRYSVVKTIPRTKTGKGDSGDQLDFATQNPITDMLDTMKNKGKLILYGYQVESSSGAQWTIGSAYGFEFQTIELPAGFLFGSSYSTTTQNPIQGEKKTVYRPDESPTGSITVYQLRPNATGSLAAQAVAAADNPTSKQQ